MFSSFLVKMRAKNGTYFFLGLSIQKIFNFNKYRWNIVIYKKLEVFLQLKVSIIDSYLWFYP